MRSIATLTHGQNFVCLGVLTKKLEAGHNYLTEAGSRVLKAVKKIDTELRGNLSIGRETTI